MKKHTEKRLRMLERGWSPLPNIDKMCVLSGWPKIEITKAEIEGWDRMRDFTATGLRLDNGLCAIDFDMDCEQVEEIYAHVSREFPELSSCLRRAGKGFKEAWFIRTYEPFARIAGPVFISPGLGAEQEGLCLEIFGGDSPRQFGAVGWHTVNKLKYRWLDDRSPLNTRLEDLPEMDKWDIFELVRVVNAKMHELGFEVFSEDNAGETTPDHVYDLDDSMTFRTKTDGELTLDELRRTIAGHVGGHYYCSASFSAGPVAKNKRRCSISLDHEEGLSIWDSMTGMTHHEAVLQPRSGDDMRAEAARMMRDRGLLREQRPEATTAPDNDEEEPYLEYLLTDDGNVRQNEYNMAVRLDADDWQDCFSRSTFDHGGWVMRPMPGDSRQLKHPRRITDDDLLHVQRVLQGEEFPSIAATKVKIAIGMVSIENPHHAPRDYLAGVKWDGTERLTTLASDYLDATIYEGSEAYVKTVCRRWMISAVARVFSPGCKVDHMLILQGPQDIGKSTFFAILGGPWFGDDMPPVGTKDAKEWVRDQWVAEIAELSAMSGKDIEHVKAFLTTTTDKFRKAYGTVVESVPRQVIFGGTTNDAEYLQDTTGGRRFWSIRVGAIDLVGLRRDRDQLWAEAVVAFEAGERWYLDRKLDADALAGAKAAQERARSSYLEEEPIRKWLRRQEAPDGVLAYEVATKALSLDVSQLKGTTVMRHTIPRVMSLLGWEKGGTRKNRGYPWFRGEEAEPFLIVDNDVKTTAGRAAKRALTVKDGGKK